MIQDSAFVRLKVKTVPPYNALQMMDRTQNVLVKDSEFIGAGNLRPDHKFRVPDGERLVFDNVRGLPNGIDLPGVEVRE